MTLLYDITLSRDGRARRIATVHAREAGLVGDYFEGKPYQPDVDAVREALPYHYRKAFDRALKWWSQGYSGRVVPLTCSLTSTRGKPMGRLFAMPGWVALDP